MEGRKKKRRPSLPQQNKNSVRHCRKVAIALKEKKKEGVTNVRMGSLLLERFPEYKLDSGRVGYLIRGLKKKDSKSSYKVENTPRSKELYSKVNELVDFINSIKAYSNAYSNFNDKKEKNMSKKTYYGVINEDSRTGPNFFGVFPDHRDRIASLVNNKADIKVSDLADRLGTTRDSLTQHTVIVNNRGKKHFIKAEAEATKLLKQVEDDVEYRRKHGRFPDEKEEIKGYDVKRGGEVQATRSEMNNLKEEVNKIKAHVTGVTGEVSDIKTCVTGMNSTLNELVDMWKTEPKKEHNNADSTTLNTFDHFSGV